MSSVLLVVFVMHPAFAASAKQSSSSAEGSPEWSIGKSVCEKKPTWRFSSSESCEDQSRRVEVNERHCFLTACLDRMSSPEQVKQNAERKKRATCAQNARNLSLNGAKRDGYLKSCLRKNEASSAIASSGQTQNTTNGKPVSPDWLPGVKQTECKEKPTWHFSAAESCEGQSRRFPVAERHCFLTTCLDKMSAPERVKQNAARKKRATCAQNARNLSLSGGKRDSYIGSCLRENEAAAAAGSGGQTGAKPLVEAKPDSKAAGKNKAGRRNAQRSDACTEEATKNGLKGKAYKRFMAQCNKKR